MKPLQLTSADKKRRTLGGERDPRALTESTKRSVISGAPRQPTKRVLTEAELLAVCAMDSVNYLRRQHRNVELVRLRYDAKRMKSASTQVVRVYATKKLTIVAVPGLVADILVRKGMRINSVYPKED